MRGMGRRGPLPGTRRRAGRPVAAGQIVAITAGYNSLFCMSIIAVAISAAAIVPVKKVK